MAAKNQTENDEIRMAFWVELLAYARTRTGLHANTRPPNGQWAAASTGVNGFRFIYIVNQRKSAVQFYIEFGKECVLHKRAFDRLFAAKDQIDSTFGRGLFWQRGDDSQHSHIEFTLDGGFLNDEREWPTIQAAMVDSMIRLDHAFRPHLEDCKDEDWNYSLQLKQPVETLEGHGYMSLAIGESATMNTVAGRLHRYWRIGTTSGEPGSSFWQMMQEQSCVALGAPRLGDISWLEANQPSREKLRKLFEKHYPKYRSAIGNDCSQFTHFVVEIAEGDIVLPAKGKSILGIGRVVGGYEFHAEFEFPHQRQVEWLTFEVWQMPESGEGLQSMVREIRKYNENILAIERRIQLVTRMSQSSLANPDGRLAPQLRQTALRAKDEGFFEPQNLKKDVDGDYRTVPTRVDAILEVEVSVEPQVIKTQSVKTSQPKPVAAWIERLFASQAYKDRKEFIRRHAPDDEIVIRCLEALNDSGGIMTPSAFSKSADIATARLDGLIARIQRLLNMDGYEILTFSRSENRIELNVAKLKRQFDLD